MNVNSENLRFIMGFKVRQFRQEMGMSLKELAAKTRLSISYLSEIEKGKKYPKPEKILQLSQALEVSFDELVSLQVNKEFDPLPIVFSSPVIKEFPFRMYGVKPQDLLSLITGDPEKSGALIRTFLDIGQDYNMRVEHLLLAALRSYQQMHNNYFEDIENAALDFREANNWSSEIPVSAKPMRQYLIKKEGYHIDENTLEHYPALKDLRYIWINHKTPTLLLQSHLLPAQKAFIFGRELGYCYLKLKERPRATMRMLASFEQLLNNFKAAYFSSALLMNRENLLGDLRGFLIKPKWDNQGFLELIYKYDVTPEMFLYRLCALMPRFFNLREMIFFRFHYHLGSNRYEMTNIFNMTQMFIPNGLDVEEHYCRRWMSIQLLKQLNKRRSKPPSTPLIAAQKLNFINIKKTMFSINLAYPSPIHPDRLISVTVNFLINEAFKRAVSFWNDPMIKEVDVNETCERCGLSGEQCMERAVPGRLYEREQDLNNTEQVLHDLVSLIKKSHQ